MSLQACAALVERGDPDRFLAAMAAPPAARARLFPLYAFNLEVTRAPWVTQEALIAEMRLQWWRDALAEIEGGGPVRAHEVTIPLAEVIRMAELPVAPLDALVAARRRDIGHEPFPDVAALWAYLDETTGNLMWAAALALGGADEGAVRSMGQAAGLAAWLVAVPRLVARGLQPLPDSSNDAIRQLAQLGLVRLAEARAARARVPRRAGPALMAGWRAGPILRMALRQPERVTGGRLVQSEFARRGSLLLRAATGRW
jgi:15-cis-phytoene synthase